MVQAIYWPPFEKRPILFTPALWEWIQIQQRRQAECYWQQWCERNPLMLPMLLEFEDVRKYDLWLVEFPEKPIWTISPHVKRVLSDGARWIRRKPMLDVLAEVVGYSWQMQLARRMRDAGDPIEARRLNTRDTWVRSWRTALGLLDDELRRAKGAGHAER